MKIRKSINSARGYFDDRVNTKNNKQALQALAEALADELNGKNINGATITVDDYVRNANGDTTKYKFTIYIDTPNYSDDRWFEVWSDAGKNFHGHIYDDSYVHIVDPFDIPIRGSKQAVIDKIYEITDNLIQVPQGVESSMKIRRNRVTANKRRAVKAATSDMRTQFQSFLDKVDRELDSALFQYDDAVWSVKGTMSNDENGYWFELNLYCDDEEAGTVNIEVDTSSNYRTSTDEYVVSVPDSDEIQAEGNSFDDILETCVGELIRLAEDYENFVRINASVDDRVDRKNRYQDAVSAEGNYEDLAIQLGQAIDKLSKNQDNLNNFISYLTYNFPEWLKKFANTPEDLVSEFTNFANMNM